MRPASKPNSNAPRRVCFVTGTRAEYGLMRSVMAAIDANAKLELQVVVTGMHLDRKHGGSIDEIRREREIDATVPWKPAGRNRIELARQTGLAAAALASIYEKLRSDIVLLVGDRVEAFAAATAAHLSGRIVAHVHGGDRALGQLDDALRHAITKLAHVHFPATTESAQRIERLGEDRWRIHPVGSPGIDGITQDAWPVKEYLKVLNQTPRRLSPAIARLGRFAMVVLHPTEPVDAIESKRANVLLKAVRSIPFEHVIIIYPNNDPGSDGIVEAWEKSVGDVNLTVVRTAPRGAFLGLLRDAAVLVGNSSSGIIEAASFGTPVIDLGDRQKGRERGKNVIHADFTRRRIEHALNGIWNQGRPKRCRPGNIYGTGGTGRAIARVLAGLSLASPTMPKLIAY